MFTPYAPRPIHFLGELDWHGWRLKSYSIAFGPEPIDWPAFEGGLSLAKDALPNPAETKVRPGLGFFISHRGKTADYVVVAWWDQENELPIRVFVRPPGSSNWRSAQTGESVCVWDLEVIAFERDAYVATLLNADCTNAHDVYLHRRLTRIVS